MNTPLQRVNEARHRTVSTRILHWLSRPRPCPCPRLNNSGNRIRRGILCPVTSSAKMCYAIGFLSKRHSPVRGGSLTIALRIRVSTVSAHFSNPLATTAPFRFSAFSISAFALTPPVLPARPRRHPCPRASRERPAGAISRRVSIRRILSGRPSWVRSNGIFSSPWLSCADCIGFHATPAN